MPSVPDSTVLRERSLDIQAPNGTREHSFATPSQSTECKSTLYLFLVGIACSTLSLPLGAYCLENMFNNKKYTMFAREPGYAVGAVTGLFSITLFVAINWIKRIKAKCPSRPRQEDAYSEMQRSRQMSCNDSIIASILLSGTYFGTLALACYTLDNVFERLHILQQYPHFVSEYAQAALAATTTVYLVGTVGCILFCCMACYEKSTCMDSCSRPQDAADLHRARVARLV